MDIIMKLKRMQPLSKRTVLGVIVGVITATILIFGTKNYVLSTVLGTLLSFFIAHPVYFRDFAILGCVVGLITGPSIGVRQYFFASEPIVDIYIPVLVFAILTGIILNCFLGTVYGVITGVFVQLFKKGQAPFFFI